MPGDTRMISELSSIELGIDDLFAVAHKNAGSDTGTGYDSGAVTMAALGLFAAKNIEYNDLTTSDKKLIAAINELKANSVVPYKKGDTVSLYRMVANGYVTSAAKTMRLFFPFSCPIGSSVASSNSATIAGNVEVRTVDGKYIVSGNTLASLGTVTNYKTPGGLFVDVTSTAALPNATNNTPVVLFGSSGFKLTFN